MLKTISALLYVLVVFLVVAAIVTLAASILGCVAVCCSVRVDDALFAVRKPWNFFLLRYNLKNNNNQDTL